MTINPLGGSILGERQQTDGPFIANLGRNNG